jgi:hypothetical protein
LLPYWILFAIFAAGSLEYRRRGMIGTQAAPFLAVAGLFVALMVGLRWEVGGDWINYLQIYEDLRYSQLENVIRISDPGYAVLNWVGQQLGFGIWFVNLFCGAVFAWGLTRFARRQANPWLAIVVAVPYLIIVVAMGYTRQGVAIGFILAGLSVVDRASLFRFSIYVILAATFHKSAVIVLPLIALAATRNRVATIGILLGTGVLLYYLFVSESVDAFMEHYVEAQYQAQGAGIRVAMNLPPAILFLLFQKRFLLDSQQKKLWRNFSYAAFAALAMLMLTDASAAVDRMSLYLIPLQMFVFSHLAEAFPDRRRANTQLVLFVVIYYALIQFVWLNYAFNAAFWVPYQLTPIDQY